MFSPKLLNRVPAAERRKQFSSRTKDAYEFWVRRFIVYYGKRLPVVHFDGEMLNRRLLRDD